MPRYLQLEESGQPVAQRFGERLKKRRQALGLTQAQLFEQTGITAAYISFIERGRANPTLDMVVRLAEAVSAEAWVMIRPGGESETETALGTMIENAPERIIPIEPSCPDGHPASHRTV